MKALFSRLIRPVRALPPVKRIAVIGGVATLAIALVAVVALVPSGPSGTSLLAQAAKTVTESLTGASSTPAPTRATSDGNGSNSRDIEDRDINGDDVCDRRSRTASPDEREACTKGFVAPAVEFADATCEATVPSGTYTVLVKWKTVGGNFTTSRITSRWVADAMSETWTITNPTPDTVILDGRQVRVSFASMNGEPGTIDSVKSSPSPRFTAGELCGVTAGTGSTPAPTDEPTPEATP